MTLIRQLAMTLTLAAVACTPAFAQNEGNVVAPDGTVIVNGTLTGAVTCDRLLMVAAPCGRVDHRSVIIRKAKPADQPVIISLAVRLTAFDLPRWRRPDEISNADARAMLEAVEEGSHQNEVLMAERDGEVVGCLHMLTMTDFFGRRHAHISVIATTEAAEGTGVGTSLLKYAEEWAQTRGMSLLTLNVFDGNQRARRFYERAGFAPETLRYTKEI
jgi:ribosomal protein S18 acetylase RimI-like enzyme